MAREDGSRRSRPPAWARALLARTAPRERRDDVLGDLEEAHGARVRRHGRLVAWLLSGAEALDVAWAFVRARSVDSSPPTAHRSPGADGRRRGPGPPFSALDLKLGLRMMVRYPGMTLVAGLAIAFAVGLVTGFVEFGARSFQSDLPLPKGEDLVMVQIKDRGRTVAPTGHDFLNWRNDATTLREWTAFQTLSRNLDDGRGPAVGPIRLAAMTPRGLETTGVLPLLGRTLDEGDAAPGAPDVVVLGHDVWVGRFGADLDIVGRTVPVGGRLHTVVGVMPDGFRFPVAHDAWTALRVVPETAGLEVFTRLAPGADRATASAGVHATLDRTAGGRADHPDEVLARTVPYKWYWASPDATPREIVAALGIYNLFFGAMILMICANIALLVFARAAAREQEMVVREALGAGRRRIVGQLFAEALVLAVVASAVGLGVAALGVRWALSLLTSGATRGLPFWMQGEGFSIVTVGYAVSLALGIAVLTGVLPAFRVTRDLAAGLRRGSAGGGGLGFGGVWTVIIVVQVAATAALPVVGLFLYGEFAKVAPSIAAVADGSVLVARLELDGPGDVDASADVRGVPEAAADGAFRRAWITEWTALRDALTDDPDVRAVSFSSQAPSQFHHPHRAEFPGAPGQADERGLALFGVARIGPDYFEAMGARLVAGRGLGAADFGSESRAVVVDESFVTHVLGGRNAVGRPIRLLRSGRSPDEQERTPLEIVGVVEDLGVRSSHGPGGVYRPTAPGAVHPVWLVAGTRDDPAALTPRLLDAARTVNPALRVHRPRSLRSVTEYEQRFFEFTFWLAGGGSAVALFLSLTGIYSVLAFTVSRRTREIGVRVALGGRPHRIAGAIFRRPFRQVGAGLGVGLLIAAAAAWEVTGRVEVGPREVGLVVAYAGLMLGACLTACVVPTRRALAVEPNDALRAEG